MLTEREKKLKINRPMSMRNHRIVQYPLIQSGKKGRDVHRKNLPLHRLQNRHLGLQCRLQKVRTILWIKTQISYKISVNLGARQ